MIALLQYVNDNRDSLRPDFLSMTLLIIAIVTGLVVWALRLMDRAVVSQEFSLMLAGFLVASAAAAMVGVYFLMSDYMVYMHQSKLLFQEPYSSSGFVILDDQVSLDAFSNPKQSTLDVASLFE